MVGVKKNQCSYRKSNGKRCHNKCIKDSNICFVHEKRTFPLYLEILKISEDINNATENYYESILFYYHDIDARLKQHEKNITLMKIIIFLIVIAMGVLMILPSKVVFIQQL